jgi:DNA topoisomerase-1
VPLSHTSKNSQADAHEGIRPTHVHALADLGKIAGENGLNDDLSALYRLIVCRTMASQMSQSVYRSTVVHLVYGGEMFNASGSVLEFPGFSKIYEDAEKLSEEQNEKLPQLNKGQSIDVKDKKCLEKFTKAPSRYTEATLVKELEKRGIGRPSTYAAIMKTLKERKYLVIQKKFLVPTESGERLIGLLKEKYQWVVDYDFTRSMEDTLDLVEHKNAKWQDFVRKLHERLGFISPPSWNVRK